MTINIESRKHWRVCSFGELSIGQCFEDDRTLASSPEIYIKIPRSKNYNANAISLDEGGRLTFDPDAKVRPVKLNCQVMYE